MGGHTCWLSYFTLVRRQCGRTVAHSLARCAVTWLPNFLGWLPYFLSYGAPPRVELRYKLRSVHTRRQVAATIRDDRLLRVNRSGDQLQQHVAATDHSLCTGPATSCRHMLRRYIAVTNRFKCTGEIFWKSLSLQQNFVASTSRINSVWFDFLQHIAAAKLCCRDKHFHTNSPVHTKRFVAVTCRCDLLLQLVA